MLRWITIQRESLFYAACALFLWSSASGLLSTKKPLNLEKTTFSVLSVLLVIYGFSYYYGFCNVILATDIGKLKEIDDNENFPVFWLLLNSKKEKLFCRKVCTVVTAMEDVHQALPVFIRLNYFLYIKRCCTIENYQSICWSARRCPWNVRNTWKKFDFWRKKF